jgi:hypothetical protein
MRSPRLNNTLFALLAAACLSTAGCEAEEPAKDEASEAKDSEDDKGKEEAEVDVSGMREIDMQFGLYADMPDDWGIERRHVMFRDESTKSGTAYVEGAKGWVVGPKDDKGNVGLLNQRLAIHAIPKDQADKYAKHKWDKNAEKWKEAGDYVVFVDLKKVDDAESKKVFKSLTYKK